MNLCGNSLVKEIQMKAKTLISFPTYNGIRCLMMPYIQGEPDSVPERYRCGYEDILERLVIEPGEIGFLTIDESHVVQGEPHRGARARFGRALHTEAGKHPERMFQWGGSWGSSATVNLEPDVRILISNNIDNSCAVWDAEHPDTSLDGDIGDQAKRYPYSDATFMKAGEVFEIGILTPHESMPIYNEVKRQFLRIVSKGVHGRESYFTQNELVAV